MSLDRREELFNINSDVLSDSCGDPISCLLKEDAIKVMDEYFTERAMELLQYMADNSIRLSLASTSQEPLFMWKGELLTKEQVFENFL